MQESHHFLERTGAGISCSSAVSVVACVGCYLYVLPFVRATGDAVVGSYATRRLLCLLCMLMLVVISLMSSLFATHPATSRPDGFSFCSLLKPPQTLRCPVLPFFLFLGKGLPLDSTNSKRVLFFSHGHWASGKGYHRDRQPFACQPSGQVARSQGLTVGGVAQVAWLLAHVRISLIWRVETHVVSWFAPP